MKLSLFYELTTEDPDVPGAVKQRFDEAGIEFAFPSQTHYVKQVTK